MNVQMPKNSMEPVVCDKDGGRVPLQSHKVGEGGVWDGCWATKCQIETCETTDFFCLFFYHDDEGPSTFSIHFNPNYDLSLTKLFCA